VPAALPEAALSLLLASTEEPCRPAMLIHSLLLAGQRGGCQQTSNTTYMTVDLASLSSTITLPIYPS